MSVHASADTNPVHLSVLAFVAALCLVAAACTSSGSSETATATEPTSVPTDASDVQVTQEPADAPTTEAGDVAGNEVQDPATGEADAVSGGEANDERAEAPSSELDTSGATGGQGSSGDLTRDEAVAAIVDGIIDPNEDPPPPAYIVDRFRCAASDFIDRIGLDVFNASGGAALLNQATTGFERDVIEGYINCDLANAIIILLYDGATAGFPDEPMLDCFSGYLDQEAVERALRDLAAGGDGGDDLMDLAGPYSEAVSSC